MSQAGILFLFSGHKTGYLNHRAFHYDANQYGLLTVALPLECEISATPDYPLAGMRMNIDLPQRQNLVMETGENDVFCPPA